MARSSAAQHPPGLRPDAGLHGPVPRPDRADPAVGDVRSRRRRSAGARSGRRHDAARARVVRADASARRSSRRPINVVFGHAASRGCWCATGFPVKRLFDALVDLPFALPTAVAGIALTTLYAPNGWLGQPLAGARHPGRVHAARHRRRADFIGLPFVVRTVQPVLEDLDPSSRRRRRASAPARLQTFARVLAAAIAAGRADRLRARVRARASASTARSSSSPATCRCAPRSRRC